MNNLVVRSGPNFCRSCGAVLSHISISSESRACSTCLITWRGHEVLSAVLLLLGYASGCTTTIKPDLSRRGLGISDDHRVARALSTSFSYVNTFLHQFPIVDLERVPRETLGQYEFITCSDVLEHTSDRLQSIQGIYQMLIPGGFAVITVPVADDDKYKEYFPNVSDLQIVESQVVWRNHNGEEFIEKSPQFHGGDGQTLVFRQWTRGQLKHDLESVGFEIDAQIGFSERLRVLPELVHVVSARKN